MPSATGLQSAAYLPATALDSTASVIVVAPRVLAAGADFPKKFTPDALAARTPRFIFQALGGPDSSF